MKEFQDLKDSIRTVTDYPVQGVQFRDITTLLQNASLFRKMIDGMTQQWADVEIDAILSIESRGFIMAGALACNLDAAFIPLRKPQKLPFKTHSVSYELEYGATDMHIHTDALDGHTNLLIIDDLLATGGTVLAALDLIKKFQDKEIIGAGFVINLPDLGGAEKLKHLGVEAKFLIEF
ncbi:adenine phosphoribosyltransferase [Paracoccaceae bacterium]|nr:adenine phosphoribosyltransferase [Paracoccaceae bacterium]